MNIQKISLLAAGTARLTKLVVSDSITDYLLHKPIGDMVDRHLARLDDGDGVVSEPGYIKYLDGLKCPWCVGFWIGAGVLAGERLTRNRPVVRATGKFFAEALALNLVTAPAVAYLSE